jgi:Flp pilus assembly pilin Flp
MAKNKLNNRIKQLESELIEAKIDNHSSEYIHIPKPNGIWCAKFFGFLFTIFLAVMNFLLIKLIWVQFNLGYVSAGEEELVNYTPKAIDLIVLYPLIAEYILIGLSICLFVSLFKEIKSFEEDGLIASLIAGLIYGLIASLIAGLIVSLIYGLIVGLIASLIVGLIVGLGEEFNNL